MKITIYTLTTDTDDGFSQQAFASEAAQEKAAWDMLLELWDEGEFDGERPDPETADLFETWDYVRKDDLDSLWLEQCEVEIPEIAAPPVPAEIKTPRIGVRLEGGMVQAVYSDAPVNATVYIIDYDCNDGDGIAIDQSDGTTSQAWVSDWFVPVDPEESARFDAIDAALNGRED